MRQTLLTILALIACVCIALADASLDPSYTYQEPTIVTNTDSVGSNKSYTFICNNIEVSTEKGARYPTYFGVNAGYALTFTATQPIKAIVVKGAVKRYFDATASSGTILYPDAEDDEWLEAEQILAVKDVNSTTLTISCEKQLRCYSVAVYFTSDPEINIEEEEDDYSFEWEPNEATALNITFDTIEVNDMTAMLGYACTELTLSNTEYEMELSVFAATVDGNTYLPTGTYPINDTYEVNTVMASPGGYEEMDFPSYLITDFMEQGGQVLYNTVYYLESGTLEVIAVEGGVQMNIRATTHFGTTINALYFHGEGEPINDAVESTAVSAKPVKVLHDSQLLIHRNGKVYNADGRVVTIE